MTRDELSAVITAIDASFGRLHAMLSAEDPEGSAAVCQVVWDDLVNGLDEHGAVRARLGRAGEF